MTAATATTPTTSPPAEDDLSTPSQPLTADQWLASLGNVPLHRIVMTPPPGQATVEDAVRLTEREPKRSVELIRGTLVEKPMGLYESVIGSHVNGKLYAWAQPPRMGVVSGEQGMIQMIAGNIRMPEVAFFSTQDLPDGHVPREPAPKVAPTLAVEVLSQSNTDEEMQIKVSEYFNSGVRMAWLIDPQRQSLRVYDAPDRFYQLTAEDTFDGGELLPGFSLRVSELFEA